MLGFKVVAWVATVGLVLGCSNESMPPSPSPGSHTTVGPSGKTPPSAVDPTETPEPALNSGPERDEPSTSGPSGRLLWSREFGARADSLALAIAVSPLGNLFVASSVSDGTDFGAGPIAVGSGRNPVALTKVTPGGRHVWTRVFKSSDFIETHAVVVDANGNVFLAGRYSGEGDFEALPTDRSGIFLVKLRHDGVVLWTRTFHGEAGSHVSVEGLTLMPSGNLVIAGTLEGNGIQLGDGRSLASAPHRLTMYLARITATGETLWAKELPSDGSAVVTALSSDDAGRLALGLTFEGGVDFDGGRLNAAAPGPDRHGVALLDSTARHLWSAEFPEWPQQVALRGNRIAVVGTFGRSMRFANQVRAPLGASDGFLAWFEDGKEQGWIALRGEEFDGLRSVQLAADHSFYVSGASQKPGARLSSFLLPTEGLFAAHLSPEGEPRWLTVGFQNGEWSGNLAVAESGDIAVAGNTLHDQACGDLGCEVRREIGLFKLGR